LLISPPCLQFVLGRELLRLLLSATSESGWYMHIWGYSIIEPVKGVFDEVPLLSVVVVTVKGVHGTQIGW
jgi:hypothetical protein